MDSLAKSFLSRIKAGLTVGRDLSYLSQWLVENTRHPKDSSRPWSYDGHEYQIDILSDHANDLCVKKCSQVGASEVWVRGGIGLTDIYPHSTVIYTLPTSSEAALFAKARFDSVIDNSPELRSKVDRDTDNTSIKKIGDSFLYIRGTFTQKAAISIPADILIHDEVDFSDAAALTSFTSRLGHVKEEDVIKRQFSTPTVAGYGISELFDDSTQNWRAVKCDHCGTWQVPKFLEHVVIPGFNVPLIKIEKEDVNDKRYRIDEAYLSCPGCRQPLSIANLADPNKREWVAANPGATRAGYQIQPFDVPHINPPARTLRFMKNYKRKSDWVNFAVGQDYQDAETSFVKEAVENAHCLPWIEPRIGAASGTVMGVDVGKTSWVLIGVPNQSGHLDVIHYEKVRVTGRDTLPDRAAQLFEWYGSRMLVIDAGPEWTEALAVLEKLPEGKGFACYYKTPSKPTMSFVEVDEDSRVVSVDRTSIISEVAKKVNGGATRFCKCPEQQTMIDHLDVIKKVTRRDNKGNEVETWINSGGRPDHYGHALFFATAAKLLLNYSPKIEVIPALPLPGKVRVGGNTRSDQLQTYLDRK